MGVWSDMTGALDHAAGSTDEAIGRTFDNQPGGGVIDGTTETVTGVGEAVLDVPADAFNATTGTGQNLGWFGVIDRQADPRSWDGDQSDWADPSEATTGISGFFAGATQAGGHVVGEAAEGAGTSLWNQPKVLALAVLAVLVVLAPYAQTAANLSEN